MIKIIKEGVPVKMETFHCSDCGCVFKADDQSYRIDTIYPTHLGYSLILLKINCPCCDNLVISKIKRIMKHEDR